MYDQILPESLRYKCSNRASSIGSFGMRPAVAARAANIIGGAIRIPSATIGSSRMAHRHVGGGPVGADQTIRARQFERDDGGEEEADAEAEENEARVEKAAVVVEDPDGQKSDAEQ